MADADNETNTAARQPSRVVVVTAGGENPWIMINALAARFDDIVVLQEQPESKSLFLRRRARKLRVADSDRAIGDNDRLALRQALYPEESGRHP